MAWIGVDGEESRGGKIGGSPTATANDVVERDRNECWSVSAERMRYLDHTHYVLSFSLLSIMLQLVKQVRSDNDAILEV